VNYDRTLHGAMMNSDIQVYKG